MRAIIVNAQERTVSEAEIEGSLKNLQSIVGGLIAPVYEGLDSKQHHAYVNDEGLLNDPQHFFMLNDGYQPLAGNGVILGTTDDGDEAPCTLPLDWVKQRVTFMDVQAVRQWAANEPGQEVVASFVGEPEAVTEAKHTPGPWEDNGSGLIYGQVSGDEDEAPFVADCCKDGASGFYSNEEQANARLIAAAPRMKEAFGELLEQINGLRGESSCIDEDIMQGAAYRNAREAIAQAEGRSAEAEITEEAKPSGAGQEYSRWGDGELSADQSPGLSRGGGQGQKQ